MSRKYIGARYVPKFYENSLDPSSCEWEPNVNYEPLTVVTLDNDHCYISKKTVPSSIGTPAQNATYWLDQGSYSAYIRDLQSQIDALSDELDDFKEYVATPGRMKYRKIVILTDSYGQTPAGNTFYDKLLSMNSDCLVDQSNIYCFAYGSRGFVGDTAGLGSDASWMHAFFDSNDYQDVTDRDKVTEFYVLGGCNDVGVGESNLGTAATNLLAKIREEFPNAEVFLGFWGFSKNLAGDSQYREYMCYYHNCAYRGYTYISNANTWLHYTGLLQDNVHPTSSGATRLASGLNNFIFGRSDFQNMEKYGAVSATVGMSVDTATTFRANALFTYIDGQHVGVKNDGTIFVDFGSGNTKTLPGDGTRIEVAILDSASLYTQGAVDRSMKVTVPVILAVVNGGVATDMCVPALIEYNDNRLYMDLFLGHSVTVRSFSIGYFAIEGRASMM